MTRMQKACQQLANDLIGDALDDGRWGNHDDYALRAASRALAGNLEEAFRETAHELNRSEPDYCASRRCGTCDGCTEKADRLRDEQREAA